MLILKILLTSIALYFIVIYLEFKRPLSRIIFKLAENKLVELKEKSLSRPSAFEKVEKTLWIKESENAYVIKDIRPRAPHHYLVIPKERVNTLLDADSSLISEMMDLAKALAIEKGFAEDGFRTVINTNPKGLQTVYHLHLHILAGRQMMTPAG